MNKLIKYLAESFFWAYICSAKNKTQSDKRKRQYEDS